MIKDILRLLIDLSIFISAYILAFIIRFEGNIPPGYYSIMLATLPLVVTIQSLSFWTFGVFNSIWRIFGFKDLESLFKAATASVPVIASAIYFSHTFAGYPRSIFIINWLLVILLAQAVRGLRRITWTLSIPEIMPGNLVKSERSNPPKNIMIVGTQKVLDSTVRDIMTYKSSDYKPVTLIADDPKIQGKTIHGIKVLGGFQDIPKVVKRQRIEEIFILPHSLSSQSFFELLRYCQTTAVPYKIPPSYNESGMNLEEFKTPEIEDLIGRPTAKFDLASVKDKLASKRVLVIGAGGFIGSEISRQVASLGVGGLTLLDFYPNSLFYLEKDLQENFPWQDFQIKPADVTREDQVGRVIRDFSPQIVFHAAAQKHVSLGETQPFYTVATNLLGTRNVARLCAQNGVEEFVLISTDKAANPINFMGASKRAAEIYIQCLKKQFNAHYAAVRFGNVMESTGSVVRIYKEAIAQRKPIVVSHRDAARYFMSKSEAVSLIIRVATLTNCGEIFILDMGEPVKIVDLAHKMIILAGLTSGRDIPISFDALRPGEKLVEELTNKGEELIPTTQEKIFVANGLYPSFPSLADLDQALDQIESAIKHQELHSLKAKLKEIVPTYNPMF